MRNFYLREAARKTEQIRPRGTRCMFSRRYSTKIQQRELVRTSFAIVCETCVWSPYCACEPRGPFSGLHRRLQQSLKPARQPTVHSHGAPGLPINREPGAQLLRVNPREQTYYLYPQKILIAWQCIPDKVCEDQYGVVVGILRG